MKKTDLKISETNIKFVSEFKGKSDKLNGKGGNYIIYSKLSKFYLLIIFKDKEPSKIGAIVHFTLEKNKNIIVYDKQYSIYNTSH